MVRNEFTFLSADGKTPVHAVEWLPDGPIRAVVQISHGVSEYILRYEPLASYLTARGFAVAGHDHLGHGGTVPPGGTPLYFGPRGSWQWVVRDIETRRSLARERFPGAPYFLLGHSMGSFLAREYLIRYPGSVDGAVIMGTGRMSPAFLSAAKIYLAGQLRKYGESRPSPGIDRLSFGTYNRIFAPNRTAFDWLSISQPNVDAYLADPQCGGSPSTGLFREMLDGMTFVGRPENLKKMNLDTPILFVSGSMDPVGACGKGVQRAFRAFQRAGVRDVGIKLYPGLRHEILNEDCGDVVCADLYRWMDARIPQQEGAAAR